MALHGQAIQLDLNLIKKLVAHDLDANILIFGMPGSGKSTLALNIARFLQPDFEIKQVAFSLEDYARILDKEPPVIVIDENFFRKRERQKKSNIILTDVFDRIRGLNIIHVWCVPTLGELDTYMRWERTRTSITSLFLNTKVMFDETGIVRKGFAWKKDDVLIRLREIVYGKLKISRGMQPLYSFTWEFVGIEDLLLEYKKMKKDSIEDAKKKLKEFVFGTSEIPEDGEPVKEFLTPADIAKETGVSYMTVLGWIRSGKLKAKKVGNEWRIHRDWFEEYIESTRRRRIGAV